MSKRTNEYRSWVEAFARNHKTPMEWAQKGVRKEEYVSPWLRRMERAGQYGVYFIFQSMEQGPTSAAPMPKFPTQDPNHRILAQQRSRFMHYYFYLRDETLGPMAMRVAIVLSFPDHLLSQRPLLHRTGIETRAKSASARMTMPSWPLTTSPPCKAPPTGSPAK